MKKLFKNKSILIALFWAAAMITTSYLLQGHEHRETLFLLMIAGWVATGGISSEFHKAECRAFKRLIGKS